MIEDLSLLKPLALIAISSSDLERKVSQCKFSHFEDEAHLLMRGFHSGNHQFKSKRSLIKFLDSVLKEMGFLVQSALVSMSTERFPGVATSIFNAIVSNPSMI